jgi:ribosomal protein S18 acetylase RimI-like enzyme
VVSQGLGLTISMQIQPATSADLPAIRAAYAHGRAMQRESGSELWPEFPDTAILAEINSGGLLRVLDGNALVGVFTAVFEDAALWGDRERHAHIYLHRIARTSTYSGRGLVDAVLAWAQARGEELGLEGLRMDTWASNEALIAYYGKRGFTLVGRTRISNDSPLPHYRGLELALMERPLSNAARAK